MVQKSGFLRPFLASKEFRTKILCDRYHVAVSTNARPLIKLNQMRLGGKKRLSQIQHFDAWLDKGSINGGSFYQSGYHIIRLSFGFPRRKIPPFYRSHSNRPSWTGDSADGTPARPANRANVIAGFHGYYFGTGNRLTRPKLSRRAVDRLKGPITGGFKKLG